MRPQLPAFLGFGYLFGTFLVLHLLSAGLLEIERNLDGGREIAKDFASSGTGTERMSS